MLLVGAQGAGRKEIVDWVFFVRGLLRRRGVGVVLGGVAGFRSVFGEYLRLHFLQGVAGALVEAGFAHEAWARQALAFADHGRVDAVRERSAVLARVVRYVFVFLLVDEADALVDQLEGLRVSQRLRRRFQIGNALNRQHHVGEQLVQFAMLIFGGQRGRLSGQWGTRRGVRVGVLLVS